MYEIDLDSSQNLLLSCEYGEIAVNSNKTKFGFVEARKSLERLHFSFEDTCTNYIEVLYSLQPCIGKNRCNVVINRKWINQDNNDCIGQMNNEDFKTVFALHCKQVLFEWSEGEDKRSIFNIYMVNFGLCAAVCIFSIYYLWA